MKTLATLSFALLAGAVLAQAQTTITGTVLGFDGKPMPKAHVHLADATTHDAITSVEAGKDGRFTITADRTGVLLLQGSGASHQMYEVPLYIEKSAKIDLSMKLSANDNTISPDGVKIIGDFNEFKFGDAQQMDRQPDGTYVAEFETNAPVFMYQLLGFAGGHSVNGTQSVDFVYDGGGDYRSVITPENGVARIVFDPSKLPHSDAVAEVRFKDANSMVARVSEVLAAMNARENAYVKTVMEFKASGRDPKEFKYDWSNDLSTLKKEIAAEKNATVRQALLFSYLNLRSKDREQAIAQQAMKEIPPTSPFWSLGPVQVINMAELAGVKDGKYLQQVLDTHPDNQVKSLLVYSKLSEAFYTKQTADAEKYYKLMMDKYADTEFGQIAKKSFSPDRAVMAGKKVPDFTFVSLDDPKVTYTRAGMQGKIYLIDFWATWCGPCVGEMGNMHAAYEKYHGRGLEIVSLSFDAKPEDVATFRGRKWKMPWMHAFIDGGFKSEAAKNFEVSGIPKPVLVGADGTILATEVDLRG
jgi:thiol-disulfide isomerase/thioredoxin